MPRRKRSNTEIAAQQVLASLDKEIAQARRNDRASDRRKVSRCNEVSTNKNFE